MIQRMKPALLSLIAVLLAAAAVRADEPAANPFFAQDTAIQKTDKLDTVKQLGYAGVSWKPAAPESLATLVKQLRERDLKLVAIYSSATLTKTELKLPPLLEADLPVLKGTGATIWLPIYSKDFPSSAADGDAVAVPALQQLAELAAKHDLRVAIYPHKGSWAERVQDAVRLAKKVDRKNLGVTFNLCHCLAVGDEVKIPELLEQAMPHLFLVTINGADANAAGGSWARLIQPLGEGTYDVRTVVKKLQALNYTGPIGLQGYGIKLPPEENLKKSMTAWKEINAR
jgi:sugar phosphate isomerase/epimerase